jgi:predicted transcriptional regulator
VEKIAVKDLMIPLSKYATVSQEATLYDAILALEKAQSELGRTPYPPRAILILDKKNQVVGILGMWDVLKGLEPKYAEITFPDAISRSGFSPDFLRSMLDRYGLWGKPLRDLCGKAARIKVKNLMSTPSEGERVAEDASLNEAIHQLVMCRCQSLLVTRGKEIVGILRLADVFKEVCETTKTCEL